MSIPAPLPTDAEDVSWALSTAHTLWARNERADAVVWVKRASKAAALAQDDDRAIDLARAAAALSDALEAIPAPPQTVEIDIEVDEPPPSMLSIDDADLVEAAPAPAPAKPPPRKPPPPPKAKLSGPPPSVGDAMSIPPANAFDGLEPLSIAPPTTGAEPSFPPPQVVATSAPEPVSAPTPALRPPVPADDQDEGPLLGSTPAVPVAYSLRSNAGTVPGGFGTHPMPPREAKPEPQSEPTPEPKSEPKFEARKHAAITVDGDILDDTPPPPVTRSKPPSAPRQRVALQPAPIAKRTGPSQFPPPDPPSAAVTTKIPSEPPPPVAAKTPSEPPVAKTPSQPPVAAKTPSQPPPVAASVKPPPPKPPKPPPPRGAMGSVAERPASVKFVAFSGKPNLAPLAELVDLPDAAKDDLEDKAQLLHLTAGASHVGFGLAFVVDGHVDIAIEGGEPCTRLDANRSVRSHSSLGPTPPLRLVGTAEGGNVAVWTTEQIDEMLKTCPWVEFELASVSDAVHAVAGGTAGPMSRHLDAALRAVLVSAMAVRAVAEGEVVAAPGETVPGVFVPGVGTLELFSDDKTFGQVGPGEFLFAMDVLGGAKAQRGARGGQGGALVLFAERKVVQDLILRYPPLLNLLTMV